jgi:L-alanine-DL-glutamate epimerase-like enolase superfamily enzyme
VKLEIDLIRARLRAPFVSASGSVSERELLLLSLEGADGVVGFGEAAPLEHYDGVSIEQTRAALEDCRGLLAESDGVEHAELLRACAAVAVLPQALAAIDLALWDLAGRRAGKPVWKLLGAQDGSPIEVNATIASEDRAGAAREAGAAADAGFGAIKVKVGLGDDAGRLAAVRAAAGREMAIRIDANGAWSVDEALASLRALEPVGIELCEEPCSGLEDNAEVCAQTLVPVAIDESAALPGALDRRICDAVCLKIARCGGITGLLDAARRARSCGYEIYLASTLDGPLGIAAALHAAAVVRPDRPCGLATLTQFSREADALSAQHGHIALSRGPGLGEVRLA